VRANPARGEPVVADARHVGVDERGAGLLERPHALLDGFREVVVVGVEPAQDLAPRGREALVQRVGLAAVGLRDPARLLAAAQDLERLVG